MISVERYVRAGELVTLELRISPDVDRDDLAGVTGQVRAAAGGGHLVAWEWPVAMAPVDAVAICTRHVRDVLTAAALAWLGGGAVIDLTGGDLDG